MKQSSAYSAFELDMINRLTGARSGCFILYSVGVCEDFDGDGGVKHFWFSKL